MVACGGCVLCRELTHEERFQLVRSIGEECITDDELRNLLAKKPNPISYDGFEPSGRMHIAQVSDLLFSLSSPLVLLFLTLGCLAILLKKICTIV